MMGDTHTVHGAIWGMGAGALSGELRYAVVGMGLGAVAALGPDVDHKPATAGRMLPPVRWVVQGLSWLVGLPKHRGLSHTVLFSLLVGASTLYFLPWPLALSVSAGWIAALLGDNQTKSSLPFLWWPLFQNSGPPRWLRITTGKWVERWVVYPVSVVALFVAVIDVLPRLVL